MKSEYTRQYHGVTITQENYREILNKEGRNGINFHTKHLKAYLQGKKSFNHDFERSPEGEILRDNWGQRIPKVHRVHASLRRNKK